MWLFGCSDLNVETLGIRVLGVIAFAVGTAGGVLMAKLMNRFSADLINLLIGTAGLMLSFIAH